MSVLSNQDPEPATRSPVTLFVDAFADGQSAGSVIGTRCSGGVLRLGRDVERQMAIDTSALRLQPLITPGWGRQGIAYGPFRRRAGLVLAVSVTNGHNTSQGTRIPERFINRLWRWVRGPAADPWPQRMVRVAFTPRRKGLLRRFAWWLRSSGTFYNLSEINENLAVGWFTSEAPGDPKADGCGFVIRAALGDNGEPCVRIGDRCPAMFRGLKNIRVYYIVALRKRGAVYYAAASHGAHGLAPFPLMRPIAIDAFNSDETLYPGVQQCAMGQIGFRIDTRVHGILVQDLPEFATGDGSVQTGDPLRGAGPLRTAHKSWRVLRGKVVRTRLGAHAAAGEAVAVIEAPAPSGLIHVLMETNERSGAAGLVWRFADERNFWLLRLGSGGAELVRVEDGAEAVIATDHLRPLKPGTHSVQITDGYGQIGCYVDGVRLFDRWVEGRSGEDATAFGMWFGSTANMHLRELESHPREFPMPASMTFEPPWRRLGDKVVIADRFERAPGVLAGRSPEMGHGRWHRVHGNGTVDVAAPTGARIRASVANPSSGRTFHALPWMHPGFADLEVTIRPPGTRRGQDERCRSGLVYWQDQDNYLSMTAWLDDHYEGASISVFTKRHGFEELYDAVWTMVADSVTWGQVFRLRVVFDGNRFVILLDDEPVMERALADIYPQDPPLRIVQVGLATNWEWGDDTGSVFESFTARA